MNKTQYLCALYFMLGFALHFYANAATTLPRTTTADSLSPNCDFTQDFCNWQQEKSKDAFDWTRGRSRSRINSNTGPSGDHTGGGYYAYVQSSGQRRNNHATIYFKFAKPVENGCFSLFYYMYGLDIDTLSINSMRNEEVLTDVLWEESGSQGTQWLRTSVPVKNGTTKLLITATVKGSAGDIAIDDLMYIPGPCSDFEKVNCTFDKDLCGWTQDRTDRFDWTMNIGETQSLSTGPLSDHTTGQGSYIYIESSGRSEGDIAGITYSFIRPYTDACISLHYHMYGSGVGSLNIGGKGLDGVPVKLWSRKGSQGNSWHRLDLPISKPIKSLTINGSILFGPVGDIAIDDIMFSTRPCLKRSTKVTGCPNVIGARASPKTGKGSINLATSENLKSLTLPIGRYPYQFISDVGQNCTTTVVIYDQRHVQRLAFEASYQLNCSLISNPVTREMLLTTAGVHNTLLSQLCGQDCNVTDFARPLVSCGENSTVVVMWPTNAIYEPSVTAVPSPLANHVSHSIRKLGKNILKVVTGANVPPVSYPMSNEDGLPVGLILIPDCTGKGVYNKMKKTCE